MKEPELGLLIGVIGLVTTVISLRARARVALLVGILMLTIGALLAGVTPLVT
jgi:hypothetical protein